MVLASDVQVSGHWSASLECLVLVLFLTFTGRTKVSKLALMIAHLYQFAHEANDTLMLL